MSDTSFSQLHLYEPHASELGQSLSWPQTTALKEQLLMEISTLQRQREKMEQIDGKIDFSLQQTCKEMIHSRQMLYRQLGS